MRINTVPPREIYSQYVHVTKDPQSLAQIARAKSSKSVDQVDFANTAVSFSATLKAARDAIDAAGANTGKIEDLRSRINEGSYSVPGVKVAESMLGIGRKG